jgi:Cu2+-exporting ATPase
VLRAPIALPIAAGVFEPAFGLVLRPEIAARRASDRGGDRGRRPQLIMLRGLKTGTARSAAHERAAQWL